ncbi:MAG: MBOAT family O-acyltransferase [Candidatus Aminicenantes bacterium]|jgi:D-alanyl-lipoteichoic acid acyltransferase DltB (MBOAT superfamily)
MPFNSFGYLLVFLPFMVLLYYFLTRLRLVLAARVCLILGSLFFYSWGQPLYLLVILGSTSLNYFIGNAIIRENTAGRNTRTLLVMGIILDLVVLGYFKYTAFFVENLNALMGRNFNIPKIVLPLAISFYTFQQIAFLIDSHRGQVKMKGFLEYCQFVCFFPQLISGPIVRFNKIIPQHNSLRSKIFNYQNISTGILLIAVGLFKKTILADSLAVWADTGFDQLESLNVITAWVTSLSYTFQVYFDFSSCIDIALGSACLFNIKLPVNFDSPYKALNIRDFWRKWHITLSEWLRDYLFLPIAYFTMKRIHQPTLLKIKAEFWGYSIAALGTMLLAGIWHGAGWNFLLWGGLHGAALIVYRVWTKTRIKLPTALAWFLTFNFINLTWVFFRANRFKDAFKVIGGMFSFQGLSSGELSNFLSVPRGFLADYGIKFYSLPFNPGNNFRAVLLILISFFIVLLLKNSNSLLAAKISPVKTALWTSVFIFIGLMSLFLEVPSQFIYFRF